MNYLTAHAEARYVTAGNPGHVTVPKAAAAKVAPAYRDRLILYWGQDRPYLDAAGRYPRSEVRDGLLDPRRFGP